MYWDFGGFRLAGLMSVDVLGFGWFSVGWAFGVWLPGLEPDDDCVSSSVRHKSVWLAD